MKKTFLNLLVILLIQISYGQVTLSTQDFETLGYTLSHTFDDGSDNYCKVATNFTGLSGYDLEANNNNFIGAEDTDAELGSPSDGVITLGFDNVTITNYTNLTIQLDISANTANRYDQRTQSNGDYVDIQYNIDNAGWITIGSFCSPAGSNGRLYNDTDLNGIGGEAGEIILNKTAQTFIFNIPNTGNELHYRAVFRMDAGSEEIAMDNFIIKGTPANSNPTITTSPTSLTGFNYEEGNGPSVEQTFFVTGTNLTNDILVGTFNDNHLFSLTSGGPYLNSLTLTQTSGNVSETIYVILQNGLTAGNYPDTILLESTGATDVNINVDGIVTVPTPTITATPLSLTGFTYEEGNGPSAEQNFSVTGTNLTNDILVGTFNDNHLFSLTSGGPYSNSLTLTQTSGNVNETIYVILQSGLTAGNYPDTIIIESTGATDANITVDGIVTEPCSQLLISEYGEPSSGNGKYIEIYNPTTANIDLSNYELWKITNGGNWPENILSLTGSIPSNGTYTIANNSNDVPNADFYDVNFMNFNGDDAMGLAYNGGSGTAFNLIDAIGTNGADPGSGWDVAGINNGTRNHTLIRKHTVQNPNTDWTSSAGTNTQDSEWIVGSYNLDDFGNHTSLCRCDGGIARYNGGWVNGILPDSTKEVIIESYYAVSVSGAIEACRLEVTQSGTLIVNDPANTGIYVAVKNDIINNGRITVFDNGSLMQTNNSATVTGTPFISRAIVETTVLQDEARFTYVGSPVQGQNTDNVFSWASQVWDFDENTQFWNYLGTGTSANIIMGAGVGYAVNPTSANINSTQTMSFDGHFNNGVITRPLVLDVGTNEPTVPAGDDDSTLVANPYPSGLNLIGTGGLIDSNTINNVLIWTHDSALDPSSTTGYAGDDYIVCSLGGCTNAPTGGSHNGIAAIGQGFFVNAIAAGTLTFNNDMRTINSNQFVRSNSNNDKVWINLENSLGYNSNILLNFTNNGTTNFDTKYDAKKPLSTTFGTSFYSLNTDNEKLAINDNGLINESITIPVGFIVNDPAVTDLSINIANIENLTDTNIYIVDHVLNITHDLKMSNYNFTINNTGENNTRFEIIFSRTPLSIDNNNIANTNLTVSDFNETQVKVNMLDGSIIKNLKAFDTLGRLVINMDTNSSNFIINKSFNQGQILIVKATLENGQVLTTKFIKL